MGRSYRPHFAKTLAVLAFLGAATIYGFFLHKNQIFPYSMLDEVLAVNKMDPWQSPHFRLRYNLISAFPVSASVVMVGDSITELADWRALLPGLDVVNQGISGDTTVGLLKRIELVKRTGARTIALMFGVNDLQQGQTVEQVNARYLQAIDELSGPGICLIVQSTLLTRRGAQLNRSIAALNEKLIDDCKTGKCTFVDLNAKIAPDGELPTEATVDGIHPTAIVYKIWRDVLFKYFAACPH